MSRRDEALAYLEKSLAAGFLDEAKAKEIRDSIMARPEDAPFEISDKWYRKLTDSFLAQLWPVFYEQIQVDFVGREHFPEDYASGKLKYSLETLPAWLRQKARCE